MALLRIGATNRLFLWLILTFKNPYLSVFKKDAGIDVQPSWQMPVGTMQWKF